VGINNFRCSYYCNEPDSIINIDGWKAYSKLSEPGYKHLRVNHFVIFVEQEMGVHKNIAENNLVPH
jgi:hypothetical protein